MTLQSGTTIGAHNVPAKLGRWTPECAGHMARVLPWAVQALIAWVVLLMPWIVRPAVAQPEPRFELSQDRLLVDETVAIAVTGLPPGQPATVRLQRHDAVGLWRSHATFLADDHGRVDLTRTAPLSGTYSGVAPMGLVWSQSRDATPPTTLPGPAANPDPVPSRLTAEIDGTVVATATLWRRAAAADVQVTEVQDEGLVGVFYQPPGPGPHPAVLAFGGSGGGVMSVWSHPGGLASRGYAVLALGYFGVEGRPPSLSRIPLEYFKTALDWLAQHPAVDADRIGVIGTSRGGEVALLLGATYPQIAAVVAYVPSHVVWAGCCDASAFSGPAWTHAGEPIPRVESVPTREAVARHANGQEPQPVHQFLAMLDDEAAVAAAVIPVERISGPLLLISGRDDQTWPSTYMSEQVVERLRRYSFSHPVTHLAYDDAGHAIGRPHFSTVNARGGTPEGNARARAQSWARMLEFLEAHLRRRR